MSCPQGWEKKADRCYLWTNDRKTWFEAENYCRSLGGHLASVTSQDVHTYMMGKQKRVWIGGTNLDDQGMGEWVWTDCSVWGFLSGWKRGEPSGNQPQNGNPENCLEYFPTLIETDSSVKYLWNDKHCHHQQEFVCAKNVCPGKDSVHIK